VLVAGAAVVSVLVESPDDEVTGDTTTAPIAAQQFCAEAASFRSFDELNLEEEGAVQLQGLATSARRLASLSPPTIAADFDAVAQAFESVASVVVQLPPGDPDRLATVTESLDDALGAVQEQGDRAADYLDTWCGPPPTSGAPPPTPEPDPSTPETSAG
jgi:hypothetical protein